MVHDACALVFTVSVGRSDGKVFDSTNITTVGGDVTIKSVKVPAVYSKS